MIEKKDQHRWGCKERLIRRGCILIILFGFVLIISLPVTAATTSIHIVRYANDGTTILNETTKTYQWLQANLPILGDGTIHYYAQGPVFLDNPDPLVEEQLRWNPGENTNVQEKDQGAVKGTNLKNLCDLAGGMKEGEYLTLRASDGLTKSFTYTNVYQYASRQGPMVITWYRDGQYVDSGYADGMKLVFFADTSVNPWGIHAMGNYDWHESADPQYWYYYFDGNERYPTTTGLSIKYISDVFIYSDDSPPSPPVAAFSATPRSGTAPLTVTFTDASTGTAPLTYAWDFQNDGSVDSTLKNPSYQYTAAGTYTVKLTVTNTVGSDPEVKAGYITVSAVTVAPVAAFSATPRSGTAPLTVTFTDASTGTAPLTYAWDFQNDGSVDSTLKNPSYQYTAAGTYTAKLTVTNTVGSDSEVKAGYITVSAVTVAPVAAFTGIPVSGTAPLDVTFTDSSTGTSITNRRWDFGDGNISNYAVATNPSHRYMSAGTYTVLLNVTNAGGFNTMIKSGYIKVSNVMMTRIGIFNGGNWYIDFNGDGQFIPSTGDRYIPYGATGWTQLVGDWNGDGTSEIGIFKDGLWYIDYGGSGVIDANTRYYSFGGAGWIPIVGDWNADKKDEIGVYQNGNWYLDYNGNGAWDTEDKNYGFGTTGWTPVVGKWTADGISKIGIYNAGNWYIDFNGDGQFIPSTGDRYIPYGATGWTQLVGDWNGDGTSEIGIFKDGLWYIDYGGSGVIDANTRYYSFGGAGWTPIIGDWNADKKDEIGVNNAGNWYLDYDGNGVWSSEDKNYGFGTTGWMPVIGKWS